MTVVVGILLTLLCFFYLDIKKRNERDLEREKMMPEILERAKRGVLIEQRLYQIALHHDELLKNAEYNSEKIRIWDHRKPKIAGQYKVKYSKYLSFEDDLDYFRIELFSSSASFKMENYNKHLTDAVSYWNGNNFDIRNVKFYLIEV